MVKRLSTMQETWVWSLGQEDSLEKEMVTHSSTFAWKIPWTEKPGVHGVAKSQTGLSNFSFTFLLTERDFFWWLCPLGTCSWPLIVWAKGNSFPSLRSWRDFCCWWWFFSVPSPISNGSPIMSGKDSICCWSPRGLKFLYHRKNDPGIGFYYTSLLFPYVNPALPGVSFWSTAPCSIYLMRNQWRPWKRVWKWVKNAFVSVISGSLH